MSEPFAIIEASTAVQFEHARTLFMEYGAEFGWDLSSGFLAEDIADLPGAYGPPRGALLLAYVGAEPAGVLGLRPVAKEVQILGTGAETFAELKRLYVRSAYRRAGIARALMTRAEEEARRLGYRALVLTTSAELMPLAQPMYRALGYVETVPYRSDMVWPDIRWMRKDL